MRTSQAGINLIKSFEGLKLQAYQDQVGVWTIGYGTTQGVHPGMSISLQEAERLLADDLEDFERGVAQYVQVQLNENEFSALVSFSYNLGLGSLQKSTLLKLLNAGDRAGAAGEFVKWNKAGGVPVAGLTRRRTAERDLFLSGSDSLPNGPSDEEINLKLEDIENS